MDNHEILRLIDDNLAWAHRIAGAYAQSIRQVPLQDIKQEAGIALCRAADTFDPSRNIPFLGYAHRCITNKLDSLYGKAQRQALEETILDRAAFPDDLDEETYKDRIPAPEVDAAREAHRNEVRRALAQGLATLSLRQQEILLAWTQGNSYQDIAVVMGSTRQAIQKSASRALVKLRNSVEAKGVSGAMFMPEIDGTEA